MYHRLSPTSHVCINQQDYRHMLYRHPLAEIISLSAFHRLRRRSSVNFRGQDIFARKICIKNNKIPEFYIIFALPENARILGLHNNCPKKIFFPNFGGTCPPDPVFYAYVYRLMNVYSSDQGRI